MTHRKDVLESALNATMKSRNESYGDPFPNLCVAGELKAVYRKAAGNKYHPAHDEAIDMVLSKIARIACGAPEHTDNYVDAAAYAAIAAECQRTAAEEERFAKAHAAIMKEQDITYQKALTDLGLIDDTQQQTTMPLTDEEAAIKSIMDYGSIEKCVKRDPQLDKCPATVTGCRIAIRALARSRGMETAQEVLDEFKVRGAALVPNIKAGAFVRRCRELVKGK